MGLAILAAPPPPTGPGDLGARSGGTLVSPISSASMASSVTSCQTQKYLLVRLLRRRLCGPHCRDAMHPSLFSIKDIMCRVLKRERSEFCKEETASTPPSGRAQKTPDIPEGPGPGWSCLCAELGPRVCAHWLTSVLERRAGQRRAGTERVLTQCRPSGCHRSRGSLPPMPGASGRGCPSRPQPPLCAQEAAPTCSPGVRAHTHTHTRACTHTRAHALSGSSVPSSFYFMFLVTLNRWKMC